MKSECKVSVFLLDFRFQMPDCCLRIARMNGYFLPRHPEKNGPAHFAFLHSPGLLCRTSAQTGLRARTAIKERQVCRDCDKSGKESVHVIRRNSRRHRLHGCQREGQLSFLAGAFAGGNPLYGIYPAGSAASSAEEEVAVSVPSAQTAVNVTLARRPPIAVGSRHRTADVVRDGSQGYANVGFRVVRTGGD